MPKSSTGYVPNRSKSNPLDKESTPLKMPKPSKGTAFPEPIKGPNATATLPKVTGQMTSTGSNRATLPKVKPGTNLNFKPGSISKPAKIAPRKPKS